MSRDRRKWPVWVWIIRATSMGGEAQAEAVREIHAHGSWLSENQLVQAGLTKAQYDALANPTGEHHAHAP